MSEKSSKMTTNCDPVCGKRINRNKAHICIEYQEQEYRLCCPVSQATCEKEPNKYKH